MGRRTNDTGQAVERSKVEVFYAKAEGSSQSLQDLMRALTTAIGRPVQVNASPKLVQNSSSVAAANPQEATLFDGEPLDQPQVVDTTESEQPENSQASVTRRKRGEGANRDRNSGLTIVKSLNLRPTGKPSLRDFIAEKKPQSQIEHIAVYVYYLKQVLEEQAVSFSHIYTCFKEIGERMPGDLPQTCRNTASQKGWIDTADQNDLKRTTRGDNLIEHELPRSGGKGDSGAK